MGAFSAQLRVWSPGAPEKTEAIVARVDRGAVFRVGAGSDGFSGSDTVVIAERNDMEVIGANSERKLRS